MDLEREQSRAHTDAVTPAKIEISAAAASRDIDEARALFREYQAAIGVDLCFQGFEAELAALPGDYAPPRGRLLLARNSDLVAGGVALRPLADGDCEMKRLYVRTEFRATGLGRMLAERLIAEAQAIGYRRMCLDTLPTMTSAQRLYVSLGFVDIAPYRPNPIGGTRFMGLAL